MIDEDNLDATASKRRKAIKNDQVTVAAPKSRNRAPEHMLTDEARKTWRAAPLRGASLGRAMQAAE